MLELEDYLFYIFLSMVILLFFFIGLLNYWKNLQKNVCGFFHYSEFMNQGLDRIFWSRFLSFTEELQDEIFQCVMKDNKSPSYNPSEGLGEQGLVLL